MIELWFKTQLWMNDLQALVAVIFGMVLQFFIGVGKTWKVAAMIIGASLFFAMFVIPAILEIAHIPSDSKIAYCLFALSSVMSIELLAIFIKSLPAMARDKFASFLGVKI